jgi:hypothetical protein
MNGVSITVLAGIIQALTAAHGNRLMGDHGRFNRMLEMMGQLEREWQALERAPAEPKPTPPAG